ncbi:MAG: hypothetical protein KC503_01415 [Myxococcales bacterium]|nr:hypothetical protein [Myxococcales bacterium]
MAGLDEAETLRRLGKLGAAAGTEFETAVSELEAAVANAEPTILLAAASLYGLTQGVADDGSVEVGDHVGMFSPFHVELLQAFALAQPSVDARNLREALSPNLETFKPLLTRASTSFALKRFEATTKLPRPERHRAAVLERMRGATHAVRNWGYPRQVFRLSRALFAPMDDRANQQLGFRPSKLVQVFEKLIAETERRLNRHRFDMQAIFRAPTVQTVFDVYCERFPDVDRSRMAGLAHLDLESVKALLIQHRDLSLPDIYTFTTAELAHMYDGAIDVDVLEAVLDRWCHDWGALVDVDREHFFLGNPIWQRPLVRVDNGYFMPIPTLGLSFCTELVEQQLSVDGALFRAYEHERAKYLENAVAELFAKALPDASLFCGSLWTDPESGKEFENDLLVQIDSHIFVVEAKSGKITGPARRGAPGRVKKTIEELVVAPSAQAGRFVNFLAQNPGKHSFKTRSGTCNEVDTTDIHHFRRLSVTFELFPLLSAPRRELIESGLATAESLAWSVCLADLETIFDILATQAQRIHFLTRRPEFEEHALFTGDEIDLLALYLDNGLNIGEVEFDGVSMLQLAGASRRIDEYYMHQSPGAAQRPSMQMTAWWSAILETLEKRKTPRWTDLACLLLNLPPDDQRKLEVAFRKIKENVKQHRRTRGHQNAAVMSYGPPQRRAGVVALAHTNVDKTTRDNYVQAAISEARDLSGVERVVVITRDLEHDTRSYSAIACAHPQNRRLALGNTPAGA